MTTLFGIDINEFFKYTDDIYKLVDIKIDNATVICIARKGQDGKLILVSEPRVERLNPYTEVEAGRLETGWRGR